MSHPVRRACIRLPVLITLLAIVGAGCDRGGSNADRSAKLAGTWQMSDPGTASHSVVFIFTTSALDLKPNKTFKVRPRTPGADDAALLWDGTWAVEGSVLTLTTEHAPGLDAAGKVMTLDVSPEMDRLTMQKNKLVFQKTQ